MKLTRVRIENFRGLRDIELDLDEVTVLIGENNSGKTSVLDALRLCLRELGPRRRDIFEAFDFHLQDRRADPQTAQPIRIQITFAEQSAGEWDDALVGRLNRQRILQVDANGTNRVVLSVVCSYDSSSREFIPNWSFLNLEGKELTAVSENALAMLQREVAFFYLTALRDAAHHFDARGPFWRPFLKQSQLSPEREAEIEQKLQEVNELIVSTHASFNQARERLARIQDVVPMAHGDVVSIEAVPGRMFDMLARAQIHLGSSTGARVPVAKHGEGTQSLAVLMLFSAFLDAWTSGSPVVAVEEPEAHLHPSATRALWDILGMIRGQKLVSTHSGDLLSEVDIHQVRRLASSGGQIRVFRVPSNLLTPEESRKLSYHIRSARGELLFARCWLLVEGETEAWVYAAAARALGFSLHRDGVRIVEYCKSDVGLLAKIANTLGIAWYCVIDNDAGRSQHEPRARDQLDGAPERDRLALPYRNMEVHLLENGYEAVYGRHMPEQNLARLTKAPGDPDYWAEYAENLPKRSGTKTGAAAEAAAEMEARGATGVTAEVRAVLEKVITLARAG